MAAHSGLFVLGRFADALGFGEALSAAVPQAGERAPLHDRGKVLVHLLLMLAGGGEACSDIEHLRAQRVLFGEVASDSTLYRTLRGLGPDGVAALLEAAGGCGQRCVGAPRRYGVVCCGGARHRLDAGGGAL